MQKIPFDIADIRVKKSSVDGFGLDIFLKSGTLFKEKFTDKSLYIAGKEANGNVTKLKAIFRENIDNILKENPYLEYYYTNSELFNVSFGHILENPSDKMYYECMDLLLSCAAEKDIEFDGYFKQKWIDSADTVISFDEDYFEEPDKIELYVFLSAMVDEEILGYLNQVFIFFGGIHYKDGIMQPSKPITKEFIQSKIDYLTKEKGVRF